MATNFEEIYDVFLSQIDDPKFMSIDETDELKLRYLKNSIPKFKKCKNDLSDRSDIEFDADLTDEEIGILGTLMVVEYYNPQINSLSNIKHAMTNKDFNQTSQANHLKELSDLRKDKKKEADKLILDYTYNNANLGLLR